MQLSKRIEVTADTYIVMEDPADYDVVACPGGVPGAVYFHKSEVCPRPLLLLVPLLSKGRPWLSACSPSHLWALWDTQMRRAPSDRPSEPGLSKAFFNG